MKTCDVCQKEIIEVVPITDIDAIGFLLVCSGCTDLYQEEHFEDIFRSPVDFDLLNADRRVLRHVA